MRSCSDIFLHISMSPDDVALNARRHPRVFFFGLNILASACDLNLGNIPQLVVRVTFGVEKTLLVFILLTYGHHELVPFAVS